MFILLKGAKYILIVFTMSNFEINHNCLKEYEHNKALVKISV